MNQWIPWLPQYAINMTTIDQQHEELFRKLNELLDATWDGQGKEHVKGSLKFLADYVVFHFRTEEDFMLKTAYPDYHHHKTIHDQFVKSVSDFIKVYEKGEVTTEMLVAVISDLGKWTRDHVRDADQALGLYLNNVATQARTA